MLMSVMRPWLKFFRVGNLVTVPGDVLAGAAVTAGFGGLPAAIVPALASVAIYMFGLADNDIVGVAGDPPERPLVSGEISMRAARIARGLCLFAALALGAAFSLPPLWWVFALMLVAEIIAYNRTKACLRMGLCRGLNVLCGAVPILSYASLACAAVWTLYIAGVTKFSEREVFDRTNQRKVAYLVYALLLLQLATLLIFGLLFDNI